MFKTADWTSPQIGGLLNECIVKEEAQLKAPKPRVEVKHVWDGDALQDRASLWKDVKPRQTTSAAFIQSAGTQVKSMLVRDPNAMKPYAEPTSSNAIGSGTAGHKPMRSRYDRASEYPSQAVECRNNPDRIQVSIAAHGVRTREKPWQRPSRDAPPPPLVPRSQGSMFCTRPGDIPVE